jgi:transposase
MDMASIMQLASRMSFPLASLVTDRFHVVKLVLDALQHIRIKYRWQAIEDENKAIKTAREKGLTYIPPVLSNGDSPKQLLARSRYIIVKKPNEWTDNQKQRAELLFENYPILKEAYDHTLEFRNIYEEQLKFVAKDKMEYWIKKTTELKIKEFNTVANSLNYHFDTILNFFNNRQTNANAESFNSKIKLFRANQRGVIDVKFFLFRLEKLFT